MATLSIRDCVLYPDLYDVTKNYTTETYRPYFITETKLHTEALDLTYADGVTLVGFYLVRDYVNNVSDYIEAQLTIPLGTFVYDVYDHLANIEVSLITTKQLRSGGQPVITTERYKAVYLLDKNDAVPNMTSYKRSDLNNRPHLVITLQLLCRSTEAIRIKTTQGNFDQGLNKNKDATVGAFIKSILSEQVNKILIENKPALESFNIEPPDNTDNLKSVTLPSGTRIITIPDYLQNKNIGVYNSGIGCYIQNFGASRTSYKKGMYVYSLYSPDRYDKADIKTIFYVPTDSSLSGGDITYRYDGSVLRIVPYSTGKISDNREAAMMSEGGGFRVANSNAMMKKPVIMKESGPVFRKDQLTTEVMMKDRKDGLNYAPTHTVGGNQFKLSSELMKKNGNYINLEVANLDIDYIVPGAKCEVHYQNTDNQVSVVKGVIHMVVFSMTNMNNNIAMQNKQIASNMVSHAAIQIFCNT